MSAVRRLRVDRDLPGPDDAYVIRVEDSDGFRMKTTLSHTEVLLAQQNLRNVGNILSSKANSLISELMRLSGRPLPRDYKDDQVIGS